jgi:hypothetical protein
LTAFPPMHPAAQGRIPAAEIDARTRIILEAPEGSAAGNPSTDRWRSAPSCGARDHGFR